MQRTACNCGHGLSACPDTACERSCPRSCAGAAGLQHRYSWAAPVWDEVDDTSILKTGRHGRYRRFHPGHCTHNRAVRLRPAIAQRFSALAVNVICCETAILLESAQSGRARRVLKTSLMTQA